MQNIEYRVFCQTHTEGQGIKVKGNSSVDPSEIKIRNELHLGMDGGLLPSTGSFGGSKHNQLRKRGQKMGNQLCKPRSMTVLAASLLLLILQTASAGVVVIGNSGLGVDSISKSEAADIFLGKMKKLPDGTQLTVIEHKDGDGAKEEFYDKVVGKTTSQLKAYWAKLVFTGEGVPPKEYGGDKAVLDHVSGTPGAIGYVSDGSMDKSVKVLFEAK